MWTKFTDSTSKFQCARELTNWQVDKLFYHGNRDFSNIARKGNNENPCLELVPTSEWALLLLTALAPATAWTARRSWCPDLPVWVSTIRNLQTRSGYGSDAGQATGGRSPVWLVRRDLPHFPDWSCRRCFPRRTGIPPVGPLERSARCFRRSPDQNNWLNV